MVISCAFNTMGTALFNGKHTEAMGKRRSEDFLKGMTMSGNIGNDRRRKAMPLKRMERVSSTDGHGMNRGEFLVTLW